MGCMSSFCSAVSETLTKTHEFAMQTGSSMACCCCPAEVVGCCLYVVCLLFLFTVGLPFFICWCICKAIVLWKRRDLIDYTERIPEDPGGSRKEGYKTFKNDDVVHDVRNQQEKPNYLFYTNQLQSQPRGDFIDEILAKWKGNYQLLENHHGFIQWLFPLFERGINSHAEVLTIEERQMIIDDKQAHRRMLDAYRLMLDFYGMILADENTGKVERAENYKERFHNLNRYGHNSLRISRIVKCLGIFNYSHLAKPFVKFFVKEIVKEGNLPSCYDSCMKFWIPALNQEDADEVRLYAETLEKSELKVKVRN